MLDWLHWGGGLIVSGPDSLDKLRGSFLEPYLPATGGTAGPLDAAKLAEFHERWTVAGDKSMPLGGRAAAPWSGIALAKHADARFVPGTGELVVERLVGRGRIVVTAFRLSEPELTAWPSFDSFVNGCLLGRPPRRFDQLRPQFEFVGPHAPDRYDAAAATHLRYFTRDANKPVEEHDDCAARGTARRSIPLRRSVHDADRVDRSAQGPGRVGRLERP